MKFSNKKSNKASNFHKKYIKKFQDKTGLTDYQLLWASFAKGLLIGLIIL